MIEHNCRFPQYFSEITFRNWKLLVKHPNSFPKVGHNTRKEFPVYRVNFFLIQVVVLRRVVNTCSMTVLLVSLFSLRGLDSLIREAIVKMLFFPCQQGSTLQEKIFHYSSKFLPTIVGSISIKTKSTQMQKQTGHQESCVPLQKWQ